MSEAPRSPIRFPVAVAIWIALATVFTMSSAAAYAVKEESFPVFTYFWWSGAEWLYYGALSPGVFWLLRRFPLTRTGWARAVPALLLGWLVFHVTVQVGYLAVQEVLPPALTDWPTSSFGDLLPIVLVKRAAFTLVVFIGIVVVAQMGMLYQRVLERERAAAELEAALTRSRLDALRGQLQPHFLFNTLNTISSLLRDDPDGAERILTRLGDLLRMSLQEGGSDEVPLERELAFLERYIDIQRVRFADRLTVSVEAAPEVRRALVPSLLLQPLVENAIRHGIEPRAGTGSVRVRVERDGERLVIEVLDDGVGIAAEGTDGRETNGHGVGLRNTRQRLEQLHGDRQRLDIGSLPGGGTAVRIFLPWQVAEEDGND
jgi:two-component system LytT family sensor kinase